MLLCYMNDHFNLLEAHFVGEYFLSNNRINLQSVDKAIRFESNMLHRVKILEKIPEKRNKYF